MSASNAVDDSAIRSQADQFAKAFAAGDAKAIAGMWTTDGTLTSSDGRIFHGRNEIEKVYSSFFHQRGAKPLVVAIDSLTFPTSDVAVEEGTSCPANSPTPAGKNRYTAVHVKRDGVWQMCSVTETAYAPSSDSEYLSDLSWLVGSWSTPGAKDKVAFKASWVGHDNFLCCRFAPAQDGTAAGVEIIGWSPNDRQIKSWHFDDDGGYGTSTWLRNGNDWVLRARAIEPDGHIGTAAYVIRKIDDNTFSWRSTKRTLDGTTMPDLAEVRMVRDRNN